MKADLMVYNSALEKKYFYYVSTFDAIQSAVIKLFAIGPCINISQD